MFFSATFLVLVFSIPGDPFQLTKQQFYQNQTSSNQTALISSLFLDFKKKTKIKSCSRCFLTKVWDSKSSQLDLFHFLCWQKNKKERLHNWDSKQGASKPCSLFQTERRKQDLPTTTKSVCFHAVSLLGQWRRGSGGR